MSKLAKKAGKAIQWVVDKAMGSGLMQEETSARGTKYVTPGIPEVIRQAGAESCVLLENDGTLPLKAEEEIAVFGRCQLDWFYVGNWRIPTFPGLARRTTGRTTAGGDTGL